MGRANGSKETPELRRRGEVAARTVAAPERVAVWPECAICAAEVTDEARATHERDWGHPFVAVGSYHSLPITEEDLERYERQGRTDRIDCRCGRTEFVRPGRASVREPYQLNLCTECLRKTGWSLPQGDRNDPNRNQPRVVSYQLKPYLPVEHRAQIEDLQHHFLRQNRWDTSLQEFKGLGELLERTLQVRGSLELDDREFLYQQGADPRLISNDCRYIICPVGSASDRRFVTVVFGPNSAPNASTEEMVVDVFDGVPSERAQCSHCSRSIIGKGETAETGPVCVSCAASAKR